MNIWQELGIPATRDATDIRRAYARRLRQTDQHREREAFQRLRAAYEMALAGSGRTAYTTPVPPAKPLTSEHPAGEPAAAKAPPKPGTPPEEPHAAAGEMQRTPRADPTDATPPEPDTAPADPRERDWQRARELVREILAALKPDAKPAAAELFLRIVKSDELHSLALREMLEWQLLHALNHNPRTPLEFVVTVAEFFDWRNRPDLLQGGAGPALQSLLRRTEAAVMIRELHDLATSSSSSAHFNNLTNRRNAARVLLSRFSRGRCIRQALSQFTLSAVHTLLREIDERAPELPQTYLDPQTVAWWRSAVETPRWTYGNFFLAFVISISIWAILLSAVPAGGISALGLFLAVAVGVNATFFGAATAVRRWRRTWGPRVTIRLHALKERSLGRLMPGAVRFGLGWRHLAIGVAYSPLIAIAELDRWSAVERALGYSLLLAILMVSSTVLVFSVYVARFQLWSWIAGKKPKWNAFRVSGYLTIILVFVATVLMAGLNHGGPITAAFLAGIVRLYRRAR